MDRLKSMGAFVMTVERGSFAQAAESLQLSPQRVAKAVAQLEDSLGMRLLHRTTRRQQLTEFGRRYYPRCRAILNDIDATDALAQQMKSAPEGRLRIGAPVTFGNLCLMSFIAQFMRDYPAIDVDLVLQDRIVDLTEEDIDVSFRIGNELDPNLVARPIRPYCLIACAAPDYLAKHGIPSTPESLIEHDCLSFAHWDRHALQQWEFTRQGIPFDVQINPRLCVNDSQALLMAAKEGCGIILGTELLLREALTQHALMPVLTDFPPPARPMHLLYPADRQQATKVKVFITAAIREFGQRYPTHML